MTTTNSTVETPSGPVVGTEHAGVLRYLGIPYAAPVTRDERFRPARPVAPWREPFVTDRGGPVAWQHGLRSDLGVADGVRMDESAHRLHIWAPRHVETAAPVIVWLHGGGWYAGSPLTPEADGEELARRAGVVVVSITHRLGLLGCLYLADHLGDDYANSGTASIDDLILALTWIRDSIGRFGGDPERVTIIGCSGGGAKVASLLAAPSARELFHRAVLQSGSAEHYLDVAEGIELVDRTLDIVGIPRERASDLLTLPPAAFADVQTELFRRSPWTPILGTATGLLPFPTVNGVTLPSLPRLAVGDADDQREVIVGSAYDEAMLPISRMRISPAITLDDVARLIRPNLADVTGEVIDVYRKRLPESSPYELLVRLGSDVESARAARLATARAATSPTRMYRLDWGSDRYDGTPRACHCLEIGLAFANVDRDTDLIDVPGARRMSDLFSSALVRFARGDTELSVGSATWPHFEPGTRTVLSLAEEPTAMAGLHAEVVELWQPYLQYVRR